MRTKREQHSDCLLGFREELAFSIGCAISRSRGLLRRTIKEHVTDNARHQLVERILRHLEQSGFELDEDAKVLRGGRQLARPGSRLLLLR